PELRSCKAFLHVVALPGALGSWAEPRSWGRGRTSAGSGGVGSRTGAGSTVTRSGAILPKPVKTPFGLLRVFSVVLPFLYVGTQISKNFAALLEEHDIFVPEDDDDDD
uniref:Essential MCU regulator, mitochondrial n=1 Tax=Anas platyrhynchos platyrhynchos TaxID=8840 RepID=U3I3E9_ANAPP